MGDVGMSCTHDEGDGAGLAMAIAGSNPMLVTPSLGACVDVVCTAAVCVGTQQLRVFLLPLSSVPFSSRSAEAQLPGRGSCSLGEAKQAAREGRGGEERVCACLFGMAPCRVHNKRHNGKC